MLVESEENHPVKKMWDNSGSITKNWMSLKVDGKTEKNSHGCCQEA